MSTIPWQRTLADDLIKVASITPPNMIRQTGFPHVAGLINEAQRYVITPKVRDSVFNVLSSKPSTVLKAVDFARMPYPVVWMEWDVPQGGKLEANQHPILRTGALLRREGKCSIRVFTAWKHTQPAIELSDDIYHRYGEFAKMVNRLGVSALEGGWDLDSLNGESTFNAVSQYANDSDKYKYRNHWFKRKSASESIEYLEKVKNKYPSVKHAIRDPKELEAMQKLDSCACYCFHQETRGFEIFEHAAMKGYNISALTKDLEDEMGVVLALLILLQSKNCTEVEEVEPPIKLNKALFHRKQPGMVKYNTVHIHLSPSQKRAAIARGHNPDLEIHDVMGHFKVRKSGVYWWSEHKRGYIDSGKLIRKGYQVEE